jgi:hypothetical protein
MGIAFLHPWLWVGLAAVAAPLLLHLARRQETRILPFSALRFLDDQPEPRRQPRRLRDLILLFLRALALALLVAAFTWPYLHRAAPGVRESRVYILDNTMSHQADGRFARAREWVLDELRSSPADAEVAVIVLEARPRALVLFASKPAAASQAVAGVQPSLQRGSYTEAFRQADALLGRALGARKRIVLVADNQENQWAEGRNTPPFLSDVEVELQAPDGDLTPNLALIEPTARRVFTGSRSLVDLSVKLRRTGPARGATVRVQAGGRTVMERRVALPDDVEEVVLQAEWDADPAEWLQGEVTVEGAPDALAADNRVFFAAPPLREGRVAVLSGSRFLRLALAPEVMRGRWTAEALSAAKLPATDSAASLADVLCLDASALQSAAARHLLEAYLQAGKGVLLLVDRLAPLISGSLRDLGFEPDDMLSEGTQPFQIVAASHPLLAPFRSLDLGNLAEVTVSRHVRLRAAQATPVISTPSGDVLLFESTRSPGRLVVTAFGLDRPQTSWPLHPSFIPFLDLMLQHLRRSGQQLPESFEPAQIAVLNLGAGVREARLQRPDGSAVRVAADAGRVQFRLSELPGLHRVTYDADPSTREILVVNPPALESSLRHVDPRPIVARWKRPAETERRPADAGVLPDGGREAALRQQLWWWLLLAALLALVLESSWVSLSARAGRAAG